MQTRTDLTFYYHADLLFTVAYTFYLLQLRCVNCLNKDKSIYLSI